MLQEKGMSPQETMSFLQSSSLSTTDAPLQSKLLSIKARTLQNEVTGASSMTQIVFRENTIAVESKELKIALLKIEGLTNVWEKVTGGHDANTSNARDTEFMALLNGYDDAISLANYELKQLATLKSGPAVNAKKFQLVNIVGYCKYQKLKLVMGRNEDLISDIVRKNKKKGLTLKHLEEVAHLYDALLQDARAVSLLPGGGTPVEFNGDSSTNLAPVEDEFLLEANANVLRLRSLRCYYLARMHASTLVHKYTEALALLGQAENLAKEACEEIGACDKMEGGDKLLEQLDGVLEEMRGEKCRVIADLWLKKDATSISEKCLLDRLFDYDIPSNSTPLAHVPPKLIPMACKPSFFDVAWNYVSVYPVDELERAFGGHEEKDGASTKSGFLGWFRR
jgi:signal recognition particle subunit SRP68